MPDSHLPCGSQPFQRPLTPLVGREEETAALLALLRQRDVRLLTLTGPGGVGKTRLALQVAEEARQTFARVAFVPLADIRDPALVLPAIARAIGVPEVSDTPLKHRLAMALDKGQQLLLLDNFEQVIAAGPTVVALLASATDLSLLITSRARLGVQGEHEFSVPPLRLPLAEPRSHKALSSREAARYGAIALFVQRARAADPRFKLTDKNAITVASICQRLDGLPLAIELAAARMGLLSAPALLALLDRRLAALTGGPRDQPERLRTMRQAIAWSYNLLSPQEQALFCRLSVFAGGFALADAETVIGTADGNGTESPLASGLVEADDEFSVLDGIMALAAQSLVRRGEWPGDGEVPLPRFMMLQTIRDFGLEQLAASGEESAARRRHAQVFLALAERAEQDLCGPDERTWLELLEAETDNLRAALTWTIENDLEAALRFSAALWIFWYRNGRLAEGEAWLGRALGRWQGGTTAVWAKAMFVWGALAGGKGDYETAVARLQQALPLMVRGDDRVVEALAQTSLGIYTLFAGRLPEAIAPLERAQKLYIHATTPAATYLGALSQSLLGLALHLLGDSDRGLQLSEEVVVRLQGSGAPSVTMPALVTLASIYWNRGEVDRAAVVWREALALAWSAGERWLAVDPLYGLAAVAAERGTIRTALRLLGAVDALCETTGTTPQVALIMTARIEKAAAASLPSSAIGAERAAGAAMPLATVVADLLRDPEEQDSRTDLAGQLTPREREVLRLLAEGRSDPEIAAALFVSRRTVATHVANLFRKLGVHSRAAASACAVRAGIA
jgi:predicted ATPase/DNA-binding CsgD family transcriptional regulator